jgi:ferredoxin
MFPFFEHVPFYPLVFAVFWGAALVFVLAMARHLRVFAAARAPGPSPFDSIPARFIGLIEYAFIQTKMFKDPRAAVLHLGIFWGFILLTVGTANVVTGGLVQAVISWPFDGVLWAATLAMQNVVAVIVIACVLWALWRRFVTRPPRLTFNRDALIILGMIGGVVAAELFAQVFEIAAFGDQPGAFIAAALAAQLGPGGLGLSQQALETGFWVLWWAHMALVAAFLVYLPFSKHLHIVTSFPNIYFRKLAPRGELPAMDLEQEDATFGVRTLADLGWKDMLDGFTCTECGRCQQACPAWNTGKQLNPKHFIMGIRDMSVEAEQGLPLIPNSPSAASFGLEDSIKQDRLLAPIVDNAIPFDAVWDCVTCGACVEACPVLIEHVDKIVDLRRNLVLEDSRCSPTTSRGRCGRSSSASSVAARRSRDVPARRHEL